MRFPQPTRALPRAIPILLAALPALAHDPVDPSATPDEHIATPPLPHFSHPLITESPSPDTKIRIDHFYRRAHDGEEQAREHEIRIEAEYAFHPGLSIEINVPWGFRDAAGESPKSRLGQVEAGVKLANYAFARYGLLLGYGLELGLPTGDEDDGIGSDHILEIEPFFDAAWLWRDLEVVTFGHFGIPTNQSGDEEVENEFGYEASVLYHVTPQWMALFEMDGETALNGEECGVTVVNLTPGVKFRPAAMPQLAAGVGVGFPITGREEFEIRTVVSVFYHF